MRVFITFFIAAIFITLNAYAQAPARAQQYFNEAMRYKAAKRDEKAFDAMERAIKAAPDFAGAYSTLGEWYFNAHQFAKASDVFRKATINIKNGNRDFAYPLAKSLLYAEKIAEAQSVLAGSAPVKREKDWTALRQQAAFMLQAMRNPIKDTIFNMGYRINTSYAEMYPNISADGLSLFYTRRTNGIDEDFYRSDVDSCGGWFSGKPLPYPINTLSQEASQCVSADRHYLFFMRCDNRSPNGWDKGGCDLYMAYTADSIWSTPESFGATINTPGFEGMPCLSSDNRELYFVSDRPGGFGGKDIWMSRFEHGLWQEPRNLGPEINTPGNEISPYLFADNQTLYFASDGHVGMGGSDLYRSKRVDDSTWSHPENLGYPINTPYDEISLNLTQDGKKAYLSSDRDSAAGNFDIYEMNWPENLQPQPVTFIKGYVYDSLSKERLNNANIFISDASTGAELYEYKSNRGDGSFTFTLPLGKKYSLIIDRYLYKSLADTLTCDSQYLVRPMEFNISMLPSDYVKPVSDSLVLVVYFKKNSVELSDSAKAAIDAAMQSWLPQNDIHIFLNGYTDNSGTPIGNEQLSYQRANLVAANLAALKFSVDILEVHGWGEVSPVAGNDTEEDRDKNRRVEIVIRK
ncbi:OmpA family protein [Taibaiella soli]|uniref:OmpA-like domain-containing protein n=1 Tax=Taibaiella soli TaxID=1649169 RepID=A0A2W2ADB5_9BACT|nr:OmpA family protein [Taibaiella soli]PZF73241.1 hypothetical protein DN068_08685 [Taibaiella soli]